MNNRTISSIAFCAALAVAAPLAASAAVYLKPLAAGETRAVIDGASWATAYTNAHDAIPAAVAAGGDLYAAAGVYVVKEKITVAGSLAVYGGFAGVAGETLADRDPAANQTIFTGDKNLDDYWVHYEPNTNANNEATTALTALNVIVGGRISPPPAYTGEWDAYAIPASQSAANKNNDNTAQFLAVTSTSAALTLDGVVISGFWSAALNGNVLNLPNNHNAPVTLTNVNVVACASYEAAIWTGANFKSDFSMRNCRFAWCVAKRNAGVNLNMAKACTIADCAFESIWSDSPLRANTLFVQGGTATVTVEDCSFARMARASYVNNNYGGPSAAIGGEQAGSLKVFRNCVVTNCYARMSSGTQNGSIPIVAPASGTWVFENCRIGSCYVSTRSAAGSAHTLVGSQANRYASQSFFNGCVFDRNAIVCGYTAATSGGSYALGVCGSFATGSGATFANCVFDRNVAEDRARVAGVSPVLCDGVLGAATVGAARHAVANCTFRSLGVEGVRAVAQYGDQHAAPLNVANSLFLSDAEVAAPFLAPNGADADTGICVWRSTAQNVLAAPPDIIAEGWQFDPVPVETGADGVLTPSARTPGIRDAADIMVDGYCTGNAMPAVRIRLPGASEWQPLNTAALATANLAAALLPDIAGDARPEGGVTRGAKQVLTARAESGHSLVLRRSPFAGGTLSGPACQSVAPGAPAVPVTAVPADGTTFSGWYTEGGELYSANATLSLASLDTDLLLVAKFGTRAVTVTFDLGAGGTFASTGSSTATLDCHEGDAFPDVPAFTASPDWIVTGWSGDFPAYVAATNAAYAAQLLTTASRVFHVVPPGDAPVGSDGSGSSWENATDDIAAAIADAARYRGELWLKGGVYTVSTAFDIRSNVGVYGGFAGTETAREAADPAAHPTVMTGDSGKDDYWKPNGAAPEEGSRVAVYDYGNLVLNRPDPASTRTCWRVSCASDSEKAFTSENVGAATNAVFSGLTFVSFTVSAIYSPALYSETTVSNCAFYACGVGSTQPCPFHTYGSATVRDCAFVGCRGGIAIGWGNARPSGGASLVENCLFEACESSCLPQLALTPPSGLFSTVSRCTFRTNVVTCFNAGMDLSVALSAVGANAIRDCLFEGNFNAAVPTGTASSGRMTATLLCSPGATVERCRFIGNAVTTPTGHEATAGVYFNSYGNDVLVRDSYFAGNAVAATSGTPPYVASCGAVPQGRLTFANCTMEGNSADAGESATTVAATAVSGATISCGLAIVHCALTDSSLSAAAGNAAELRQLPGEATVTAGIGIVNSVLYNTAPGYVPLALNAGTAVTVASSHLSNLAVANLDATPANSYLRNVTAADPRLRSATQIGGNGAVARGLTAFSPLAKGCERVWLAGRAVYIHDPAANASKPWRLVGAPNSYSASVEGLTTESPLLPDAFGKARDARRAGAGPLVVPAGHSVITLR